MSDKEHDEIIDASQKDGGVQDKQEDKQEEEKVVDANQKYEESLKLVDEKIENIVTTESTDSKNSESEVAKDNHLLEKSVPVGEEVNVENEEALEQANENENTGEINEVNDEPIVEEKGFTKRKDEKPLIPDDFFYDYDSLVFKPVISEDSNLKSDLLNMFHSFGYDCKKRSNLNILDPDTLIFSAGNVIQILNMKTKHQTYIRTTSGGGVGAIAVHPTRQYFAVGEKGNTPNINVYEYPSLKIYRILRQGTIKGYAHLDFNVQGDLLASLGASPDFMLTLWDWRQENIVLRTKAFSQDVYKVTFSKDLKGILTTAGTGHIRFWKMANTFTGFKLQGELGKFGKTEISDIDGYAELPDGKVLSGCEWGNMLLWDGGLIQTEICRKKNKPCHIGSIQQITLDEGDIYTIGEDGTVRVWDFETIDTAEPSEEGVKLEIEPLNELLVGKNVSLKSMIKDSAEESTIWYAQDSNGGIWRLDLSFGASSEYPKQIFNYHAGIINGIDTCPNSHLLATTADDGTIKVYNYLTYEIMVQRKFSKGGSFLKWMTTSIDSEGSTILTGFKDGVLRCFKILYKENTTNNKDSFELVLFEAFKPHTQTITSISIDSKGEIIATGSEDNTVFFFSNRKNKRIPIGFVKLPSAVTYMCWTPDDYKQNRLLVCMKDGSVYEYDAPNLDGGYDISKTYLIEMKLNCRKYKFKSIKSRLRHEEELERKRIEEEERKKKEAEERRLRGLEEVDEKAKKKDAKKEDGDSKEEKNEEQKQTEEEVKPEEQKKEDEWKPYIPETPSKICWANYSSPDTFWLSMDDYDAGYLYECKFLTTLEKTRITTEKIDEPFYSVAVQKSDLTHSEDIPLTCLTFNKSKTYAFMGQKNGVLRCQPVSDSKSIRDLKHHWSYGFHDNEYGYVTNVCLSFDERFVFSAGADSNIFGCLFNNTGEALEKAKSERIRIATKTDLVEVSDIDDPNAYSIEQAKQKAEYDKMMANAESKKQDMRQKIYQLRKTFKDLLNKNDQLIPRLRLDKEDFMLEESIKEQVLNQIDEKINLTYRELAWYSEKCRLSLDKIKSRFKDVIDYDHLVVYTFDGTQHVSTFRSVQLPRDMDEFETELVRQYTMHLLEKQKTKESQEVQGNPDRENKNNDADSQGPNAVDQIKRMFGKLHGNTAARVERALRKMEEKKQKRLKRKKEWEDLLNAKLPVDYENPEDLASIKDAEDNLGDFKLKTSENYIVPEELRMNVFKATKRLIAIKQILHKNQIIFNQKVVDLRDRKTVLVEDINISIDKLEEIKHILSKDTISLPMRPQMKIEELPEKQYEYNKERLIEFKKEIESKVGSMEKAGNDDDGGLGGFSSGATAKKQTSSESTSANANNALNVRKSINLESIKPLWHNQDSMSYLMKKRAQAEEIKLSFQQQQILKTINDKITIFNAELKLLRHEKSKIAILNKNIDLRHVTLYEEFMLLRDFEKTENELEQKLEKRKEEHVDTQSKLNEIQAKIDAKRKDIEKLDEKQKELMNTYHHMTQDENKFSDFLTKVYKRKIKRKKKTEGAEEEEESEEESEESDSEDEDEDDEDDDSEAEGREQLDLDMCPNGLSQDLYDQVCQLREKRLDLEELQTEEKKILEQFKKDQESAIKRGKVVENTLKQAQQELENFQKEKQKKINNLDIIVTLRFDQIQFMEKGYLPSDLYDALVFDSKNLDRLQERIKELQNEKINEKKRFKQLKQRHLELIRDKKKMEDYIDKLEESSNKMMLDKFGKLVDLEKLELIAVNQQIEELKQRMAENEFEHEKVMQEWLSKINNEKDESIELLKANTSRINEIVDIMQESKKLDKFLNSKQKSLGEEFSGVSKKDVDEQERLHTLVQLQAQEIEALKAEISILSRKGGHILPPTQQPTQMQTTV